jgi:hypothetical protein
MKKPNFYLYQNYFSLENLIFKVFGGFEKRNYPIVFKPFYDMAGKSKKSLEIVIKNKLLLEIG